MSCHRKTTTTRCIWALLLCCSLSQAADITSELQSRSSGFLELGVGLAYGDAPLAGFYLSDTAGEGTEGFALNILLNGQWQWRNFFAEILHDSFTGGAIGYQAWQSQNHSVDAIITNLFGDLDPSDSGFEGLDVRKYDIVAGLRSTHHLDNSVLQFSLLGDVSGRHDGWAATATYGRFWQVKNWNFHAIAGAHYFSEEVTQHFFGVSESEASASIPASMPDDGVLVELEFGAAIPLNEKWVFRSTAEIYHLPESLVEGPLVTGSSAYSVGTSINYVF